MLYRNDQKTGNQLSILGFGLMRFSHTLTNQIDLNKAEPLVLEAVEKGVNYFDTAYVYGGSEVATGTILARSPGTRERINLATKIPHRAIKSLADATRIFGEQLDRLQTDHIDYYLVHNIGSLESWQRLEQLGFVGWIEERKQEGSIRQIGFSFHGIQAEFLKLLDAYSWDFCQIQYNYMNESYQAGKIGLQAAAAKGMPVIVMEPLLGGKLANGLPAAAQKAFSGANPSRSFAEWGFRWIWDQPEVSVVLSGMNAGEQLRDNLAAAEQGVAGCVSTEEREIYEQVRTAFSATYKVACTGCNYCLPCPKGVNIPGIFAAYNLRFATGFVSAVPQYLTSTDSLHSGKNHGPANCARCGACEKKCPQNIAIMDSLVAARKTMEPWWFLPVFKVAQKFL